MKNLISTLALVGLLSLAAFGHGPEGHGDEGHAEDGGVPTAVLKELFPKADSFVKKDLKLAGHAREHIEETLGGKLSAHDVGQPAYIAVGGGRSVGAAFETDASVGGQSYPVVVGVDPKGVVVGVRLRKAAGLEESFLKQFVGKKADFSVGGVKAQKGKEALSKGVAQAVKRGLVILDQGLLSGHKH